jgi:hypothetical protein
MPNSELCKHSKETFSSIENKNVFINFEAIGFKRRTMLDDFAYAFPVVIGILCSKCNSIVGTNSEANVMSCSPLHNCYLRQTNRRSFSQIKSSEYATVVSHYVQLVFHALTVYVLY